MTPQKLFSFALPAHLKLGLQEVKRRDGISEAEQIRRGIALWLDSKGVTQKTDRRRVLARRRP